MRQLRTRYLSLALVVLLVLTSQAMAVARGATGPAGLVELCTGSGPVMIAVDAQGAPVGPPHYCPEQALSLLNWFAPDAPMVHRAAGPVRAAIPERSAQDEVDLSPCPAARAPPRAT